MRPDPNALAQGIVRLLNQSIVPALPAGDETGAAATAARIAAILRDTDWSEARTLLHTEADLLESALAGLIRQGHIAGPLPPRPEEASHAALAAHVEALRAIVGRSVAQMAATGAPLPEVRAALARVLAECAERGIGQGSGRDRRMTNGGRDARGRTEA